MCVHSVFTLFLNLLCCIVVGEQMQSKQKSVLQERGEEWKEVERVECRGYAGNMYKNQGAK